MPAHRFLGYFFALATCATLAFASLGPDSAAPQDALTPDQYSDALPYLPVHRHKAARQHLPPAPTQMAQAD